jgi:Heparinase II/III-like protein
MVAALESTLGDSFGLADRPGFAETGDFALHAVGASGAAFNFGDSEPHYDPGPLGWFAYRFARAIDGWLVGGRNGWHVPFNTIWPSRARASPVSLGIPTGKIFRSGDLACFRNTWSRARPVYLAIKGGNLAAGATHAPGVPPVEMLLHSQADAGSFVVDGARHRWVVDFGADDYDLPGYFDHGSDGRSGRRWRYYRVQAAGHNTLALAGCEQIPNTPAPVIGGRIDGDSKWVVFDLSPAYGQPQGAIRRGAALLGREVVIADEIAPAIGRAITWVAHIAAEPEAVAGAWARFRQGKDRFTARIVEPVGARFTLSAPPPPQSFALAAGATLHGGGSADGRVSELPRCVEFGEAGGGLAVWRLEIALPAGTPRITVLLRPDCDGREPALPVAPLDHWLARRPVRLAGLPRLHCRTRSRRPSAPERAADLAPALSATRSDHV